MKISTFAENLFAALALVKQEPFKEKPYKTKDEEYEIKVGDLVLLARTNNDKKVQYAILAKVYKTETGKSFYALKDGGMKILFPAPAVGHWTNHGLPPETTGKMFDGCQYVMSNSMVDHPPKNSRWIYETSYLTDNRVYIGFENVMQFLLTTPGFEPHAGALAISWMMHEKERIMA
jgi:hypothetical protein